MNIDTDADGIARRVRLHYRDTSGQLRQTWAARVALTSGVAPDPDRDPGVVDYTVDAGRFSRMSWRDVERVAATAPETFRDRIVLVGGEFTGSGDGHHPTPLRSPLIRRFSGLVVQAIIVNTILDGFPVREWSRRPFALGAGVAGGVLAFLVLMRQRLSRPVTLTTALVSAYVAAAVSVFIAARALWPIAGTVVTLVLQSARRSPAASAGGRRKGGGKPVLGSRFPVPGSRFSVLAFSVLAFTDWGLSVPGVS